MTNAPKIIGITGNIATGKSVVGHMLANSGGLEIDADVIANRMLYPSGAAYHPVIEAFGDAILTKNGEISRKKLGEIVFSNPEKLEILESLIHPAVTTAIQARIELAGQPFIVVEAIKLLESDLIDICDSLWVSHASAAHQMERLLTARNLSKQEAQSRIQSQPSQDEKLSRANFVINTEGSFKETWQQIQESLNDTIQINLPEKVGHPYQEKDWAFPNANTFSDKKLEAFWQACADKEPEELYASLGALIFMPMVKDRQLTNLILWDNWNFTASLHHWYSQKSVAVSEGLLLEAFKAQVKKQECEIMLFSDKTANKYQFDLEKFGFDYRKLAQITYPAWQEAARKVIRDPYDKIWIRILRQPLESKPVKKILK